MKKKIKIRRKIHVILIRSLPDETTKTTRGLTKPHHNLYPENPAQVNHVPPHYK